MVAPQGAPDTAPSAQGTLIVLRLVHPSNAIVAILDGVPSKVIDAKPVQFEKANISIFVTVLGIDVNASFVQC